MTGREERNDARKWALASQVDEARGRFLHDECDECGRAFVGSKRATTCPVCVADRLGGQK